MYVVMRTPLQKKEEQEENGSVFSSCSCKWNPVCVCCYLLVAPWFQKSSSFFCFSL